MGTTRSLVEFKHDTGYGDSLLLHINNAIAGKDMIALSAAELPDDPKEHQDTIPKPTGKFRNLRELRDEMASRVMPGIKPLVWKDDTNDSVSRHLCTTPFGYWEVFGSSDGAFIAREPFDTGEPRSFSTVDECKRFCQNQFELRVKDCLE